MAKQISLITFTGRLGNMIGYYRNGKHFLRSMPETVRQTTASRHAARRFGIASKKAALIRHALNSELDVHCDSSHINRLNRTLIQAVGNNPAAIVGFRFNQETGTDRFFSIAPELLPEGMLHIPAQTLPMLKGIITLKLKIITARINFATHQVTNTEVATIIVDMQAPFNGITLPLDVHSTGTLVVALQVTAINAGGVSSNRKYQAADIVAVQDIPSQQAPPLLTRPSSQIVKQQLEKPVLPVFAWQATPMIQRE